MSRTVAILINYRNAADTISSLQSLEISASSTSVIVVDNSPNDPELLMVLQNHPGVHLIQAPENLGFGRGCNLGIRWALANTTADYIFLLNNDAMVKSGTIETLESVLDEHTDVGIVAPKIVIADEPDRLWYGGGHIDWRKAAGRIPGYFGPSDSELAQKSRNVEFASGCAMLIRRDLLDQIGLFDERFFMYEEDLNLCLRAVDAGWKIRYEPGAVVSHAMQGSLRSKDSEYIDLFDAANPNLEFYLYHILRNSMINGIEFSRGVQRPKFFFWFPIYLFRRGVPYLFRGKLTPVVTIMRAVRDGIRASRTGTRTHS